MTTYTPENLKRWTHNGPTGFDSRANYMGADMSEFYVGCGTNRDADSLTRSNWRVITKEVLDVATHPETAIHRFGHWACGWYELLLIHPVDEPALRCADEFQAALSDYPVASEDDWSELQFMEACDYWERESVSGRLRILKESGADCSRFTARHNSLPSDDRLYEYLTAN